MVVVVLVDVVVLDVELVGGVVVVLVVVGSAVVEESVAGVVTSAVVAGADVELGTLDSSDGVRSDWPATSPGIGTIASRSDEPSLHALSARTAPTASARERRERRGCTPDNVPSEAAGESSGRTEFRDW